MNWVGTCSEVAACALLSHHLLACCAACCDVQLKDEVAKSEADVAEAKEKAKKQKQHEKEWEATREERVGGWRNFHTSKRGGTAPGEEDAAAAKAKPKKAVGELKPPKLKTNDEDRLYVSRCVTEQFRPDQQLPKMKVNQMKDKGRMK